MNFENEKSENTFSYQSYNCSIDNVKEQLNKYGVAVIPNVLDKSEIKNMRTGLWDTIEYLSQNCSTPIDRYDVNTWKTWYELLPTHYMLLQTYSIGHSQFVWDVRQNPKVVNVFSKIWDCNNEDLITSYDAISFHIPPEITKIGWYEADDWFHVDASYKRKDFECVQGFVTGYDINEGDATLTLLEGSNNLHSKYSDKLGSENIDFNFGDSDWVRLSKEDLDFYYQNGCKRKNVMAKAGSLLLWDSRTVHCGMEPLSNRIKPNFRLVSYVCMTPRDWMDEKTIELRRQALDELYMTSHCPHRPKLFPKIPPNYGGYRKIPDTPLLDYPKLSELGKKISGL